jgi:hypothetical protein
LRTGRQHRDDDLARGGGFGCRSCGAPALVCQCLDRVRHDVKSGHLMARCNEVGRHRRSHIAEADKPDRCHPLVPPIPLAGRERPY